MFDNATGRLPVLPSEYCLSLLSLFDMIQYEVRLA